MKLQKKLKKFMEEVSVVMGVLSPEARNSQVNLYESGDVDYIVSPAS